MIPNLFNSGKRGPGRPPLRRGRCQPQPTPIHTDPPLLPAANLPSASLPPEMNVPMTSLTDKEKKILDVLNALDASIPPPIFESSWFKKLPLFLKSQSRLSKSWKLKDKVHTQLLPQWFDFQVSFLSLYATSTEIVCYRKMIIIQISAP